MTNELSSVQGALEQVRHAADYMSSAPASVITFVGCILAGYFLKLIPGFRNRFIPLVVICLGPILFMTMESGKPNHIRNPAVMHGVIGFTISFASWGTHRLVLKKWVDPRIFRPDDDTDPPFKPEPKDGDNKT